MRFISSVKSGAHYVQLVVFFHDLTKNGLNQIKHFNFNWCVDLRGPFEKFVYWRQRAVVMQSEAVTVMPNCSDEGKVVVA